MFVVTTVQDTIRVPPAHLRAESTSTTQAVCHEIDGKYPNRVWMDVGLVICRYGSVLKIGHGVCVAGDGGSFHPCTFRLVVFRPFVEEVLIGTIEKSTAAGIQVSLGAFFHDIFIPAYWMLNPSQYEPRSGLWVWTPLYDDEEGDASNDKAESSTQAVVKSDPDGDENENADKKQVEVGDEDAVRYEMHIGSEIRFKVKALNFTQITSTAKGMQATMTTSAAASTAPAPSATDTDGGTAAPDAIRRRRSSSVGVDDTTELPPPMHIVASICEDGLGCTSWWSGAADEPEVETEGNEEGEDEHAGDGDEEYADEECYYEE